MSKEVLAGSSDTRTLGIQVFAMTLRAAKAGSKLFNANKGQWIVPQAP